MNLSAVWIRRPVLTIVVALIPAILGLFGIMQIQVRDLPQFDIPVIQVQTVLQGATPEEVAGRLTAPIERAIATVGNIDTLVSTSDDGVSSIQATFLFGTDSVVAANQVQAAIEQIADQLPSDALKPVISRLSLDNLPVIYLSLSSEKASPVEIGDVAHRLVVPQLTTIPGVGSVQIVGDREPIMKVTVNPFDLAAVKLDPSDVISGIRNHNVATPAGNVQGGGFTTGIEVAREVDPVKEVASAPVVEQGGQSLELRDIGSVDIVGDTSATSVTINGRPAVAIGVLRQSTANSLQLVAAIQKALPDIQAILPPGMKVGVAFDTTVSIRASLHEVRDTLVLAIVLVVGVVFAFLASFRSSLITLVTIPLSLLITVVFIWLVNFSFNTFTLLAFILAIGLVVDDAIVDVENVQRHIDLGLSPIDAAFVGSAEIGFAIVATTLTLASLYMPIALAPGMLGALFREFGLTLAVAVLASGVVSRTLSPMMCSRLLRPSRSSGYARLVDSLFESLTRHYRAVLRLLLGERMLIGFAAMSIIAVGIFAASTLQGEIAPNEDEGYILLRIDGPTGATAGYLESRSAAIERVFQTVPERLSSMIILGMPSTSQGYAFLVLKDWSHRKRRVPEITRSIMPAIEAIPGISTTNVPPNPLSGGQSQPIQIVIKATTGYRALMSVADRVLAQLAENPAVQSANVDLQYNLPRIQLTVDRALASDLGVSIDSIARTLQSLFGGFQVGRFPWQGNLYKIKLELPPDLESNPRTIGLVGVKTGGGDIVPLEALVERQGGGGRRLPAPLQSAALGHHLGRSGPRLRHHAGAGRGPKGGRGQPRARHGDRLRRPVPPAQADQRRQWPRLPAGHRLHLPHARRPVRELSRSPDRPPRRPALDLRRSHSARLRRRVDQSLQRHRPPHPRRPDRQARHPDHRVRQPAARPRPRPARGGDRGGRPPPPGDLDDHAGDGPRHRAAPLGRRLGCHQPPRHRARHRGRPPLGNALLAVRRARRLPAADQARAQAAGEREQGGPGADRGRQRRQELIERVREATPSRVLPTRQRSTLPSGARWLWPWRLVAEEGFEPPTKGL